MEFGFSLFEHMTCFVYNASALCIHRVHTEFGMQLSLMHIKTKTNISLMMDYIIHWVRWLSYNVLCVGAILHFRTENCYKFSVWDAVCGFLYIQIEDRTSDNWNERREEKKLSAKWYACCWLCKFSECGFSYRIWVCYFGLAANLLFIDLFLFRRQK